MNNNGDKYSKSLLHRAGDALLLKKMLSSGLSDVAQLHRINYEYAAAYPITYIEFQMNDVSVAELNNVMLWTRERILDFVEVFHISKLYLDIAHLPA